MNLFEVGLHLFILAVVHIAVEAHLVLLILLVPLPQAGLRGQQLSDLTRSLCSLEQ